MIAWCRPRSHRSAGAPPAASRPKASFRFRASVAALVLAAAWGGEHTWAAATAGSQGRAALLRAEAELGSRRLDRASGALSDARRSFARMRNEMGGLGPLLPVARRVPFVRTQVRAVEVLAGAGILLARSGEEVVEAAAPILRPSDTGATFAGAVAGLRGADAHLRRGVAGVDAALAQVSLLDRYRLVGPLGRAHRALADELPPAAARARTAERGLRALITFAGGSGPRRYLVFSQNPDEVRPTGGYLGSYGVLDAQRGRLALERYDSVESWYEPRPQAVVPGPQAPLALRVPSPPVRQTIANVNTAPDWPQAARLAMDLWGKGGEQPVDGALALAPDFLARVLAVLGPVEVPSFGETVTAANLVERTDYHTHLEGARQGDPNRKRFLTALAAVVVGRLLDAPASRWGGLAAAVATGFDRREAMAWTRDTGVARALAERGWDGTLPAAAGDFFADAEFEYMAKNGRGLRRTYDHHVVLHRDGSAMVTTTVTIANTRPFSAGGLQNLDSASYIALYGPHGATLDPASDPPVSDEAPVAGHPASGWLRSAEPLRTTTLTVVWRVPHLAERRPDGRWTYALHWMRVPAHAGDRLRLRVDLPPGWHWERGAPPARSKLDADVVGAWSAVAGSRP